MVSARITKTTMSGIKILQDASADSKTIVQIIGSLVHKELTERGLAVYCSNGYYSIGETLVDSEGAELKIVAIIDGMVLMSEKDNTKSSAPVNSGVIYRMKGIANA